MVSSFMIRTTIRIPVEARDECNKFCEGVEVDGETEDSVKVKAYFDQGFGSEGIEALDLFLSEGPAEGKTIKTFCFNNSWRADRKGLLHDLYGKFHGAISMLEYLIEAFFKPKGIQLNGSVIGVNTEGVLVYVYHVKDNVITFDEKETRKYLEIYAFLSERLCESREDVVQMMVREVLEYEEMKNSGWNFY